MGFLKGTASFVRFSVEGQLPENPLDFIAKRVIAFSFQDIDDTHLHHGIHIHPAHIIVIEQVEEGRHFLLIGLGFYGCTGQQAERHDRRGRPLRRRFSRRLHAGLAA